MRLRDLLPIGDPYVLAVFVLAAVSVGVARWRRVAGVVLWALTTAYAVAVILGFALTFGLLSGVAEIFGLGDQADGTVWGALVSTVAWFAGALGLALVGVLRPRPEQDEGRSTT